MINLKSFLGNYAIRMSRRDRAVARLKLHVFPGGPTDRMKSSELRNIIQSQDSSISVQECGRVIRKTVTGVVRKRVHSKWYYYRIRTTDTVEKPLLENNSSKNETPSPVIEQNQPPSHYDHNHHKPHQCRNSTKKSARNQGHPFKIACFNVCTEDLTSLDNCKFIGEGTFGRCLAGKYKGLPVAIKVFKGIQNVNSVHHEANIMLNIPSHPNIAMLIGVQTIKKPYLLLTKMCISDGKPQTYSNFLQYCDVSPVLLKFCLLLLSEIADGLNHIHTLEIIHNDVKGNNVILEGSSNENKRPVIIDFGKACTAVESNKFQRKHLTEKDQQEYRKQFPHIAPEVVKGTSVSYKSDAFGFGFLYCSTLKIFKQELRYLTQEKLILELGKKLTNPYPNKRASIENASSILAKAK